jgi:prepilin signal peptidase PulO-like enzyme (type II secretory pathway)
MTIVFNFLFFLLGLTIGSFLNCFIYRLDKKESPLKGRSFCPHCKHKLEKEDLVPVLSFLLLGGKCRYCSRKISWQYPLLELFFGFLFVFLFNYKLSVLSFANIIDFVYLVVIFCFFAIIFVYDLKELLILDKIVYPAIAFVFLYNLSDINVLLRSHLPSALGITFLFLAIFLISRGKWLGFGDVKLVFFLGLFLGFPQTLVAFFLSFFSGAIIGLILILSKKKKLKSEIPFAPFLIIGSFVAFFWGIQILDWYISLILY